MSDLAYRLGNGNNFQVFGLMLQKFDKCKKNNITSWIIPQTLTMLQQREHFGPQNGIFELEKV